MRALTALIAATGLALGVASAAAAPKDAPVFVLTGSGYGHGVGMSQYGADAQAEAGRSAADILAFYYPGTQLGAAPARKLRVLLADAATAVRISSAAPFAVRDATGATMQLPAGDIDLTPDLQVAVNGVPVPLPAPLTFLPARGTILSVGGHPYRGQIEVAQAGAGLQVVDVVGLEAYVLSVVPGEMPSSWPAAALQAQAIAARSYALATLVQGKAWDLYPDSRSEQYPGAAAETPATTAAVKATAGRVLLYKGRVALTLYSSSSGGVTASALEMFGLALPYLPSQPDPWDDASPYHSWQPRPYTGRQLAKALGLASPVVDVQSKPSESGRVASLTVTSADGTSIGLTGREARKRLELRSTAFRLGTLRFVGPPPAASAGVPLRLSGVARDVAAPELDQLAGDGTWTPVVRKLRVGTDGTFAAVLRPARTTTYRLVGSGIAGPSVTIPVVGSTS